MIRLENVSTNSLKEFAYRQSVSYERYRYIYKLLTEHNISNCKELKELLESNEVKNEDATTYLRSFIADVEARLEKANAIEKTPQIFTFDTYKNADIDDETANITDNNNRGEVLLYTRCGARLNTIKRPSIAEIKHLLSHGDCYDPQVNALAMKRNFGPKIVEKVAGLINCYDEQVARQAIESGQRGVNLFTLNKDAKDEIVRSQLKVIAEYILDTANECVWGTMTDTAKKRMLASVLSTRGEYTQKDKQALIDAIRNYTTLRELENGILNEQEVPTVIGGVITRTKTKPIDRFIVR